MASNSERSRLVLDVLMELEDYRSAEVLSTADRILWAERLVDRISSSTVQMERDKIADRYPLS
jgi:hypothetical protein